MHPHVRVPDIGHVAAWRTLGIVTRPEQAAREARHLEAMIKELALDAVDSPSRLSPPLPDFELLLADGRRVGVEVTESTDPEVAAAWGGARVRLETEILRQLERDGMNIEVSAALDAESLLALERHPAWSRRTAARIAEIARGRSGTALPPTSGQKLGLDALMFLELRPAARPAALVGGSATASGPWIIQRAIDLKVAKLGTYRALGAYEYWLLVVGGRVLSGYVTADDARSAVFESPFDRSVFLDLEDGACVILETT